MVFNSSSVRQSSETGGWSLTDIAFSSVSTSAEESTSTWGPAIVTPSSSSLASSQSSFKSGSRWSSASYVSSSVYDVSSSSPTVFSSDQTSVSTLVPSYSWSSLSSSSSEQSSLSDFATTSTSASSPRYTVSSDSKSAFIIYTQQYYITGSSTTFETGLPTTTVRAKTATSSFSVPSTTQTRDLGFYQNWLNGSLGESGSPTTPAKNKIIGGVVGGVGGLLLCSIVIWLMFFRRRKNKAEPTVGFTYEIGRRAGYPSQSQSVDIDQEKTQPTRQAPFLARIKNKAIAQISKNRNSVPQNEESDPFQEEFDFRKRPQPPIPPARSRHDTNQEVSTRPAYDVPIDHRFSYVSSLTDSSYISSAQGDYSSLSSTSVRLPSDVPNHSESSHGFLREVI